MYIQLFDLIDNKNSHNINYLNKSLCVTPSLFIDNGCSNVNSKFKKYKYTIIKPDKDNDCVSDETYKKIFDDIKTTINKIAFNDKKLTKRAKKAIKEKLSRKKENKVKKPKIKIQ